MREVLTLSLPGNTKNLIKQRAKIRGFASVSEYVKNLFEEDNDLISETELVTTIKEARAEHARGETKELKSLMEIYDR
jgi:hypothetical protein